MRGLLVKNGQLQNRIFHKTSSFKAFSLDSEKSKVGQHFRVSLMVWLFVRLAEWGPKVYKFK